MQPAQNPALGFRVIALDERLGNPVPGKLGALVSLHEESAVVRDDRRFDH
jgi:hypothetical protein